MNQKERIWNNCSWSGKCTANTYTYNLRLMENPIKYNGIFEEEYLEYYVERVSIRKKCIAIFLNLTKQLIIFGDKMNKKDRIFYGCEHNGKRSANTYEYNRRCLENPIKYYGIFEEEYLEYLVERYSIRKKWDSHERTNFK